MKYFQIMKSGCQFIMSIFDTNLTKGKGVHIMNIVHIGVIG